MTRAKVLGMMATLAGLTLLVSVLVYAQGNTCAAGKTELAECGRGCQSLLKDATVEVANTAEGVVIRITSQKPHVVTALQACFADFGKDGRMCRLAGGSKPCGMGGGCRMVRGPGNACKMRTDGVAACGTTGTALCGMSKKTICDMAGDRICGSSGKSCEAGGCCGKRTKRCGVQASCGMQSEAAVGQGGPEDQGGWDKAID